MASRAIRAVWREIGAFPDMRRLGVPEVLQFENRSDELPDLDIDFDVTCELANPQQASRAMAELWINERSRALDVVNWLDDCAQNRVHRLAPGAPGEQPRPVRADRRRPQYEQLLARSEARPGHAPSMSKLRASPRPWL